MPVQKKGLDLSVLLHRGGEVQRAEYAASFSKLLLIRDASSTQNEIVLERKPPSSDEGLHLAESEEQQLRGWVRAVRFFMFHFTNAELKKIETWLKAQGGLSFSAPGLPAGMASLVEYYGCKIKKVRGKEEFNSIAMAQVSYDWACNGASCSARGGKASFEHQLLFNLPNWMRDRTPGSPEFIASQAFTLFADFLHHNPAVYLELRGISKSLLYPKEASPPTLSKLLLPGGSCPALRLGQPQVDEKEGDAPTTGEQAVLEAEELASTAEVFCASHSNKSTGLLQTLLTPKPAFFRGAVDVANGGGLDYRKSLIDTRAAVCRTVVSGLEKMLLVSGGAAASSSSVASADCISDAIHQTRVGDENPEDYVFVLQRTGTMTVRKEKLTSDDAPPIEMNPEDLFKLMLQEGGSGQRSRSKCRFVRAMAVLVRRLCEKEGLLPQLIRTAKDGTKVCGEWEPAMIDPLCKTVMAKLAKLMPAGLVVPSGRKAKQGDVEASKKSLLAPIMQLRLLCTMIIRTVVGGAVQHKMIGFHDWEPHDHPAPDSSSSATATIAIGPATFQDDVSRQLLDFFGEKLGAEHAVDYPTGQTTPRIFLQGMKQKTPIYKTRTEIIPARTEKRTGWRRVPGTGEYNPRTGWYEERREERYEEEVRIPEKVLTHTELAGHTEASIFARFNGREVAVKGFDFDTRQFTINIPLRDSEKKGDEKTSLDCVVPCSALVCHKDFMGKKPSALTSLLTQLDPNFYQRSKIDALFVWLQPLLSLQERAWRGEKSRLKIVVKDDEKKKKGAFKIVAELAGEHGGGKQLELGKWWSSKDVSAQEKFELSGEIGLLRALVPEAFEGLPAPGAGNPKKGAASKASSAATLSAEDFGKRILGNILPLVESYAVDVRLPRSLQQARPQRLLRVGDRRVPSYEGRKPLMELLNDLRKDAECVVHWGGTELSLDKFNAVMKKLTPGLHKLKLEGMSQKQWLLVEEKERRKGRKAQAGGKESPLAAGPLAVLRAHLGGEIDGWAVDFGEKVRGLIGEKILDLSSGGDFVSGSKTSIAETANTTRGSSSLATKDQLKKNLLDETNSTPNWTNPASLRKHLVDANGKKTPLELMPYQQKGAAWMYHSITEAGLGCLLADDMGLGKTIQVLTMLAKLKEENVWRPGPPKKTNKKPSPKSTTPGPRATKAKATSKPSGRNAKVAPKAKAAAKKTAKKGMDKPGGVVSSAKYKNTQSDSDSTQDDSKINQPHEPSKQKILVVVPVSLLSVWNSEAEKFFEDGTFNILTYHGPNRGSLQKAMTTETDIVLTTYGVLSSTAELQNESWFMVIADEAQNIKISESNRSRSLRSLDTVHRLAITGTPVENRLLDLWTLFDFILPGYLGNKLDFIEKYENVIAAGGKQSAAFSSGGAADNSIVGAALSSTAAAASSSSTAPPAAEDSSEAVDVLPADGDGSPEEKAAQQFRKIVGPFLLRRVKTDPALLLQLPDKVETKVICEMTTEQALLYSALLKQYERDMGRGEEQASSEDNSVRADEEDLVQPRPAYTNQLFLAFTLCARLKQVCNHPETVGQRRENALAKAENKVVREGAADENGPALKKAKPSARARHQGEDSDDESAEDSDSEPAPFLDDGEEFDASAIIEQSGKLKKLVEILDSELSEENYEHQGKRGTKQDRDENLDDDLVGTDAEVDAPVAKKPPTKKRLRAAAPSSSSSGAPPQMNSKVPEKNRKSALIFTQFIPMGKLLLKTLQSRYPSSHFAFFHGSLTADQRADIIQKFQAGEIQTLIVSLKSGGAGLTLTRASIVVHYDRWWNPAVEDQATDRAHRVGQDKTVFVYKMVCAGTLEERICSVLSEKKLLQSMVVRGSENGLKQLDRAQLVELCELIREE